MSELKEALPIIIDVGGGMVKAGKAGEDAPSHVFPAVVGKPKHLGIMVGMGQSDAYVGDEALAKIGILKLSYPVQHGGVTDWEAFNHVLRHTFYDALRVAPENHPVLLAVAPLTSPADMENMGRILFETFNCPACYIADQAKLSLSATGRTSGTVVDIGDEVSFVVPICDGVAISTAITQIDIGGRNLTEFLSQLLSEKGSFFSNAAEKQILRDIKEKLCYVALGFDAEKNRAETSDEVEMTYELPDGLEISLGVERFQCPEALFQPSFINKFEKGLHYSIVDSVTKCDAALRNALYGNIVLTGGSSLFKGITEKLQKELAVLAPSGVNVSVIAPPERQFIAWMGGSKLVSQSAFLSKWVTSTEYGKEGPSVVNRKCR